MWPSLTPQSASGLHLCSNGTADPFMSRGAFVIGPSIGLVVHPTKRWSKNGLHSLTIIVASVHARVYSIKSLLNAL